MTLAFATLVSTVVSNCTECGAPYFTELMSDSYGDFIRHEMCDDCEAYFSDLAAELQSEF